MASYSDWTDPTMVCSTGTVESMYQIAGYSLLDWVGTLERMEGKAGVVVGGRYRLEMPASEDTSLVRLKRQADPAQYMSSALSSRFDLDLR
jgi:hypothetical protein